MISILLLVAAAGLGLFAILSMRSRANRVTPAHIGGLTVRALFDEAERLMAEGQYQAAAERYLAAGAYRFSASALTKAGDKRGAAGLLERSGLLDGAAQLYAEIGDGIKAGEIWLGLPPFENLKKAAASFAAAGDHRRAGEAWDRFGDFVEASACYDRLGASERADLLLVTLERALKSIPTGDARRADIVARLVAEGRRLGTLARVVPMLQSAEELLAAARICEAELADPRRAAELYELSGDLVRAATLYDAAGEHELAEVLRAEETDDADTEMAPDRMLALRQQRALWRGDLDLAARLKSQLSGPPDAPTDSFLRSGFELPAKKLPDIPWPEDEPAPPPPPPPRYDITVFDASEVDRGADAGAPLRDVVTGPPKRERTDIDEAQESLVRALAEPGRGPLASTDVATESTEARYDLREIIGRGGMGVVIRAWDRLLDRVVALKFLPRFTDSDPELLGAFFRREARAAARLTHKGIVTVYDLGKLRGRDFISMELVEGEPLSRMIDLAVLDRHQALDVMAQVVDAVDFAHRQGVVHRDLKPGNFLITVDGTVKIADFGLARLVSDRDDGVLVLGTPAYMAPEQMRGECSAQSDIFSVGVTLYELLVGTRPGGAELPMRAESITPPHEIDATVSEVLSTAVMECLNRDPSHRPANLQLLLYILRAELEATAPRPEPA